jgi:hypothetical protein
VTLTFLVTSVLAALALGLALGWEARSKVDDDDDPWGFV